MRTAELGGAPAGPAGGPQEAEPGLGAAGAGPAGREGGPGQVIWPRVQGGLPVPPVSGTLVTRTLFSGNSDAGARGRWGRCASDFISKQWQFHRKDPAAGSGGDIEDEGEAGGLDCAAHTAGARQMRGAGGGRWQSS